MACGELTGIRDFESIGRKYTLFYHTRHQSLAKTWLCRLLAYHLSSSAFLSSSSSILIFCSTSYSHHYTIYCQPAVATGNAFRPATGTILNAVRYRAERLRCQYPFKHSPAANYTRGPAACQENDGA